MRKIDESFENSLDNLIINLCEILNPVWKSPNFTPNILTTLSLIFGLASIVSLYKGNIMTMSILYLISYFFDCNDGSYARKYNMVTDFGDMYDHVKDVLVVLGLVSITIYRNYNKHSKTKLISVLGVLIISIFLMLTHLGCQEKLHSSTELHVLGNLKNLCTNIDHIKYTKYFGCGTFYITFMLLIIYLEYTKK
jgi:phosphatidylglycerophosphate synthase